MRKLSFAGGLVLSLAAATSVVAATPSTAVPAAATHQWTTSYKDGAVRTTGTLTISPSYRSGNLVIHISGATKDEKVTVTFFDRVGTRFHVFGSHVFIVGKTGTGTLTWTLTSAQLKVLKALPATAHRDLETLAARRLTASQLMGK
jgi:hypothetical protein